MEFKNFRQTTNPLKRNSYSIFTTPNLFTSQLEKNWMWLWKVGLEYSAHSAKIIQNHIFPNTPAVKFSPLYCKHFKKIFRHSIIFDILQNLFDWGDIAPPFVGHLRGNKEPVNTRLWNKKMNQSRVLFPLSNFYTPKDNSFQWFSALIITRYTSSPSHPWAWWGTFLHVSWWA